MGWATSRKKVRLVHELFFPMKKKIQMFIKSFFSTFGDLQQSVLTDYITSALPKVFGRVKMMRKRRKKCSFCESAWQLSGKSVANIQIKSNLLWFNCKMERLNWTEFKSRHWELFSFILQEWFVEPFKYYKWKPT